MVTETNDMIQVLVYTGQMDNIGGKRHAVNVILKLMDDKLKAAHSRHMDNF
jgi:hypothetical protein